MLPAVLTALRKRVPPGATKIRFGVAHVGCPEIICSGDPGASS